MSETARPDPPEWPKPGEHYVWEMLKPHAAIGILVVNVVWNGEEWWVESQTYTMPYRDAKIIPNELSRFQEACLPYRAIVVSMQDPASPADDLG